MVVKKTKSNKGLVIYQAPSGAIELRGDFDEQTLWASQAQIAEVFGVTTQNITMHLHNIFKEGELNEKATCKESLQVQKEGKREIKRNVKFYNLDVIIAIGYRISSVVGTKFRQWATKTLKEHIVKGYTVNRKQIAKNYDSFMKAVGDIQTLLPEHMTFNPDAVLDLVKEFAGTWVSLNAYDRETIRPAATTRKAVKLTSEDMLEAVSIFRKEIISKGEAGEIFAQEREKGSVAGIVGNVMQSFGGKNLYESVEEKAAHLLYFMVKNHPFVDGNKRTGAFSFIWFLRRYRAKKSRNINSATLTALTLFVAESNPGKKDLMTALITQLLK